MTKIGKGEEGRRRREETSRKKGQNKEEWKEGV